jgi:uncharacterized membrane protein
MDHAKSPWWCWAVAIIAIWLAFWVAMASSPGGRERLGMGAMPASRLASVTPAPTHVADVISTRCAMCHAAEPVWPGIQIAPKNVRLDTPQFVAVHAAAIRTQAVMTYAMPPNNLTQMTLDERRIVAAWLRGQ